METEGFLLDDAFFGRVMRRVLPWVQVWIMVEIIFFT